jgi:hypothetical protein
VVDVVLVVLEDVVEVVEGGVQVWPLRPIVPPVAW